MDTYEEQARQRGFRLIAGVDEAGRGPLAGPVVAAAVIFPQGSLPQGLADSKTLSPAKREALVLDIYRSATAVGLGIVWPQEIDSLNIHRASLLAMERAVTGLKPEPDFLLIDGRFPIPVPLEQLPIVSGDRLSPTIAAASIIAKTTRDRIMAAYHRLYPQFNFIKNKGYPTKEHFRSLRLYGSSPVHRRTFKGVSTPRDS